MTSTHSLAAVLFDMDGTLIDTEPYWMGAELDLAHRFSANWTRSDAESVIGFELTRCAQILQDRGVDLPVDEIVATLLSSVHTSLHTAIPWRPGALRLLSQMRTLKIPTALVTMSYRELTDVMVDKCPPGTFDTIVSGDQVRRGKPHPEPYLTAAERLGVDIRACAAIEDSPTGIQSAFSSGALTIAVPNIVDVEVPDGVRVVTSLEDLSVDLIRGWVSDTSTTDDLVAER